MKKTAPYGVKKDGTPRAKPGRPKKSVAPDTPVPVPQEVPPETPKPRQMLLHHALEITSRDRNKAYGDPEDNFQNIADFWNTYMRQAKSAAAVFTSQDVAHLMILMKMARLSKNPAHYDSLLDVAGYAACAADCQAHESPKQVA